MKEETRKSYLSQSIDHSRKILRKLVSLITTNTKMDFIGTKKDFGMP